MNFLLRSGLDEFIGTKSFILGIILALIAIIILFAIFKALRKSGLILLLLTFIVDRGILYFMPELYLSEPRVKIAVEILYILSFTVFFVKIIKNIAFKKDKKEEVSQDLIYEPEKKKVKKDKKETKFRKFTKFTGCIPFIIMLILNIINLGIIPQNILSALTKLSFLYMLFKTLFNTYKYINSKDNLKNSFDFSFFKNKTKSRNKKSKKSKNIVPENKNDNRIRRPNLKQDKDLENDYTVYRTVDPKKDLINKNLSNKDRTSIDGNDKIKEELNYKDLMYLVTRGFDSPMNTTSICITNLETGEAISHKSNRCIAKIDDDKEYKVDLEFKNVNEYDYGKFVDILRMYSSNKKKYKFQLELNPSESSSSKIVLYDPSNIFDTKEEDTGKYQGHNLSMNFLKYKINFIQGKRD